MHCFNKDKENYYVFNQYLDQIIERINYYRTR